MKVLKSIKDVKEFIRPLKREGKSIGLVPTMGALHSGHISLGLKAKEESDIVIYSVFVNPTQFGPNEDLDKYPRDFDKDRKKLEEIGVDAVFYPDEKMMYPEQYRTFVKVEGFSSILCGKSRPIHFQGVTTVVLKLFNICECDKAFFGKKDHQQLIILQRMVEDLNVGVEIYPVDIVREDDGLAKSSRNVYLTEEARNVAKILYQSLKNAEKNIDDFTDPKSLVDFVCNFINAEPLANVEYVELRNYSDLQISKNLDEKMILFLAVKFGSVRLIDNIVLEK